jgi:hypothetical protein
MLAFCTNTPHPAFTLTPRGARTALRLVLHRTRYPTSSTTVTPPAYGLSRSRTPSTSNVNTPPRHPRCPPPAVIHNAARRGRVYRHLDFSPFFFFPLFLASVSVSIATPPQQPIKTFASKQYWHLRALLRSKRSSSTDHPNYHYFCPLSSRTPPPPMLFATYHLATRPASGMGSV